MLKEVFAYTAGLAAGVAFCYGIYYVYKHCKSQNSLGETDIFADKLKEKEEQAQKFNALVENQTYVELLTAKELTNWFKANRKNVASDAKMIIVTPTEENMRGLGYSTENNLDADTNIIQLFYNEEEGTVLLARLVSFTDINSNLQAELIEQEGMIIVTD